MVRCMGRNYKEGEKGVEGGWVDAAEMDRGDTLRN